MIPKYIIGLNYCIIEEFTIVYLLYSHMEEIIMYGAEWCADCRRAKLFFRDHNISYIYKNIDEDADAMEKVKKYNNNGNNSIPVVVFPDGSFLIEPSYKALEEKLSL